MKWPDLKGRLREVNIRRYLIDWDREVSGPQKFAKDFFFSYWYKDVVLEEFRIPGSLLRIDLLIVSKRIAVEVSPAQHYAYNKHFHKNPMGLVASYKRDEDKEHWCREIAKLVYVELTDENLQELSHAWFKQIYNISL